MERERGSPDYTRGEQREMVDNTSPPTAEEDDDEDDDEYGPTLPHPNSGRGYMQSGPTIPRLQDLELKRGKLAVT